MWAHIPILDWLIGLMFSFFAAIPFYFLWNGMAPIYFFWLPEVYHEIPFWHCVWLFLLISILKWVLLPKFASKVEVEYDKEKASR